jgi:hypothetical protein
MLLLLPAAVGVNNAFLLPAATPPNAVIFATERVPIRSFFKVGRGIHVANQSLSPSPSPSPSPSLSLSPNLNRPVAGSTSSACSSPLPSYTRSGLRYTERWILIRDGRAPHSPKSAVTSTCRALSMVNESLHRHLDAHAHAHAHAHTRIHTHAHAHAHTRTRAYVHTHTRTRTRARARARTRHAPRSAQRACSCTCTYTCTSSQACALIGGAGVNFTCQLRNGTFLNR